MNDFILYDNTLALFFRKHSLLVNPSAVISGHRSLKEESPLSALMLALIKTTK